MPRFPLIFSPLAVALCLGASPATAPTTQPAIDKTSASYAAGYADGFMAALHPTTQPATQPTTLPATQPAYVAAGSDLYPIYLAAAPNAVIRLAPGANYACSRTVSPAVAQTGVHTVGDPEFPPNIVCFADNGGNCFRTGAANWTFTDCDLVCSSVTASGGTTPAVAFYVRADGVTINHCGINGSVNGVKSDVGGTALTFTNNHVYQTTSVSAYITQGTNAAGKQTVISGNTFDSSLGEAVIRVDNDLNGTIPDGILIANNTIGAAAGQKQSIELRLGHDVSISGGTANAIRVGQAPKLPIVTPNATAYCRNFSISGVTFSNPPAGTNAVQIYQGSTGTVSGNVFAESCNANPPASVDQVSVVAFTGNIQQVYAGEAAKRLVGISSKGTYTMDASNVVVVVARPTTQPATAPASQPATQPGK